MKDGDERDIATRPEVIATTESNSNVKGERRLFVLDTNVLMHDPSAIFRFQEHDVYLPMVVLEELDAAKKGVSEVARNVRQVNRVLDGLIEGCGKHAIDQGIALPGPRDGTGGGRLFFQTEALPVDLPTALPGTTPDNTILGTAMALQRARTGVSVIVVSKDINLRIKAHLLGIFAEDYYDDKVLDDVDLLYRGVSELDAEFWERHADALSSWQDNGRTFYGINGGPELTWHVNECLYATGDERFEAMVHSRTGDQTTLATARDYRSARNTVWGINARNREQNFALNLLMEPDIDFVSLLGTAGTGKTLLALAAGLVQTLEDKRYREIVMTRVTVPVGEDIGFLPGTEEEKMTPWMGALMDNLEVLTQTEVGGDWGRAQATIYCTTASRYVP